MNSTTVGLVVAYALSVSPALSGTNAHHLSQLQDNRVARGCVVVHVDVVGRCRVCVLDVQVCWCAEVDAVNKVVVSACTAVAVTGRRAKPVVLAAVMLVTLTAKLSDSKSVLVNEIAAVTVAISYSLMQIETLPLDFVGPVGGTHLALLDVS